VAQASAGLGWEIENLDNNGADIYFRVSKAITLDYVDLDVAYMVTAPSAGFAEVLFTLSLTRGTPKFTSPPQVYQSLPADPDLGTGQVVNPAGVSWVGGGQPSNGELVNVILKSWVPDDGTGSQDQRHVTMPLSVPVAAGSYLACHMDHAGVAVNCEMQLVLGYTRK
jgi:hypothetical protein